MKRPNTERTMLKEIAFCGATPSRCCGFQPTLESPKPIARIDLKLTLLQVPGTHAKAAPIERTYKAA